MEIPVIDFTQCGLLKQDEDLDNVELCETGKKLYAAFSDAGFAYLSGSGIDRTLVDGVNDAVEEFFSRPLEYKMKFCCEKLGAMSYDPLGSMKLNPKRPFDHQEAFRVAAHVDDTQQYPDVLHFKEKVQELNKSCQVLLLRILKVLGVGMKLKDPDLFVKSHQLLNKDGNFTIMKLIRYPPVTDEATLEEGQLRIAEHSDFGSVTLLFQDQIGGLQVQTPEGDFVDAPPTPDTVVLNIGDMMQFWAGGRLKSTIHRVVFPTDPESRALPRRSITYFGAVDDSVVLSELEFEGTTTAPKDKTEAITSGEYMKRRFNAAYY